MATEIVMPKLGWTMEEGVLTEWLKKDGDVVNAGDIYMVVESDKSLNEIESFEGGILRIPPNSPKPGETIKVGALLAYLVQPGEPAPFETQSAGVVEPHAMPNSEGPRAAAGANVEARTNGPREQAPKDESPAISGRALRIAHELGVNWQGLTGTGSSGRIVERDVRAAHEAQQRASPLASPKTASPPIGHTRRVIAQRMTTSAHTTAPVTLTTELDATELVKLRETVKADAASKGSMPLSYNDVLIKLVALALQEHPALNASWGDDGVVLHTEINVGLAVQADRGLLVPVVRDALGKSLGQIAIESANLVARARAGTLGGDDMRGGTFTITNLGMFGVDAFTPVINLPECAILGVGRIASKVVVIDEATDRTAVRKRMSLSLTFDHRVVDGVPAARFLQRVTTFIEQPYTWLAR